MDINEVIENLIYLPRYFNSSRTKSVYDLLKEMGCFEVHKKISIKGIREALSVHPECIKEWQQFSEDDRCDGWHYLQETDCIVVAQFNEKYDYDYYEEYDNSLDACAFYIKHKLEQLTTLGR